MTRSGFFPGHFDHVTEEATVRDSDSRRRNAPGHAGVRWPAAIALGGALAVAACGTKETPGVHAATAATTSDSASGDVALPALLARGAA